MEQWIGSNPRKRKEKSSVHLHAPQHSRSSYAGLSHYLIPSSFTWNEAQSLVLQTALTTSRNIFITGGAGTGKSTLCMYLIDCLRQKSRASKLCLSAYARNARLDLQDDLTELRNAIGRKTTFIDAEIKALVNLKEDTHDPDDVYDDDWLKICGTTGTAATILNGVTLHSFSGIGLDGNAFFNNPLYAQEKASRDMLNDGPALKKRATKLSKAQMKANDTLVKQGTNQNRLGNTCHWIKNRIKWRKLCVLIIDEVSMLDPYYLNALDACARHHRQIDEPFGGVQVLTCGDFAQLPPVQKNDMAKNNMSYYQSMQPANLKYAFQSPVWKALQFANINLPYAYRQGGDHAYAEFLNRARFGRLLPSDFDYLEQCCIQHTPTAQDATQPAHRKIKATKLFYRRADVQLANEQHLIALGEKIVVYRGAYIVGPFNRDVIRQDLVYQLKTYHSDFFEPNTPGILAVIAKGNLLKFALQSTPQLVDSYLRQLIQSDWKYFKQLVPPGASTLPPVPTPFDPVDREKFTQLNHACLSVYKQRYYTNEYTQLDDGHVIIPDKSPYVQYFTPEMRAKRLAIAQEQDWPSLLLHKNLILSNDFYTLLTDTTNLPQPALLRLCLGAQVVLTKNLDVSAGLVNGARGVIISFQQLNDATNPQIWPCVKFNVETSTGSKTIKRVIVPHIYELTPVTKKMKILYPPLYYNTKSNAVPPQSFVYKTNVAYMQLPLLLADCTTYHASQGSNNQGAVQMNLSQAYPFGMAYVGLSRVTALKQILLESRVSPDAIRADPLVVEFYDHLKLHI